MTSDTGTKPIWEIEQTHPELYQPLLESFSEVLDPELGLNIIQLGLIRNVQILPDFAMVTMILTTPFCPYGPAMLENTRQKAEDALAQPARINMGTEVWDFSMMEEGLGADWGLY